MGYLQHPPHAPRRDSRPRAAHTLSLFYSRLHLALDLRHMADVTVV